MSSEPAGTHTLDGFPAAAIRFVRVLESNRNRVSKQHGLSGSEMKALFRVGESGSLTPKQLAVMLEMTTGAITAISGRLVEMGLLDRVAHPNDRRSLYLELTPAAHELMATVHRDLKQMLADSTSSLTPEELATTTEALQRVADAVLAHPSQSAGSSD